MTQQKNANDRSNDVRSERDTKDESAEKRAVNAITVEQQPLDREELKDRQLEAESKEQKTRTLSLEEAATKAKRGEKVVGDATKALGFSLGIEKSNKNGGADVLLPGRTPEEVKVLQKTEAGKPNLPFDPDELQGKAIIPAKPSLDDQLKQIQQDAIKQGAPPEVFSAIEKPVLVASGPDIVSDSDPPYGQIHTDAQKQRGEPITIGGKNYNPEEITAQDLRQIMKGLGRAVETAKHPELAEWEDQPEGGIWGFPHRGREDEFIDYESCAKANQAYPELAKQIGQEKGKIDPDLIAAVIRNEQYFYVNIKDTGPDHYVRKYGNWPFEDKQDESIGPAQMQVRNINALAKEFSKQLGSSADAVKNAETVEKAPFFVGAYFADVIQGIETGEKPDYISSKTWTSVNEHWKKGEKNEALILAYNPHEGQVEHVFTQMDAIKAPDWD